MQNALIHGIQESIRALEQLQQPTSLSFMESAAHMLAEAFEKGNKILTAGNGGSLCDAAHFAEELTGFFRNKRPALSAIVLSDPGHITCVGNDLGFDHIFSRGLEAHGKKGDVFIGLTTSGNSPNIVKAFEMAKLLGMKTIAFLGKSGGKLKGVADLELIITDFESSDRIQEAHMTAMHLIIEMLEYKLFPEFYQSSIDKFKIEISPNNKISAKAF
jgi:D-sedoheptulose 7-phosphate isomerase